MKQVQLGKTGYMISNVCYAGIVSMDDGQDQSDQYVEYAIEKGVNYFDVAPTYGDAEEKLGISLKPYRKDIFLACKTAQRDAEGAKVEIHKTLELLHTDYMDNYQLHAITTVEEVERVFQTGGAFDTILKRKEEGVIKCLGITCHSEEAGLRAIELYDFDTVLFPTNYGLHKKKAFGTNLLRACKEKNMGILGMKSLIERAWESEEEKKATKYLKSWCKPIPKEEEAFRNAAMKYAYTMGADSIVPPGNFECFSYAVEHSDTILEDMTEEEKNLLIQKADQIRERHFF
ncbi:MAG: aldo/keto reductase [Eubacteriales bacterium]